MSLRKLCSCCCSCMKVEDEETVHESEVEYLLPGGEWDPNLTGSTKRNSTRSRKGSGQVSSDGAAENGGACAYVPPEIRGTTSLPKFQDFKMLKTVGKGAFGKVMLCVHTPTNVLYAMKVVPKAKITTQKQTSQILSELKILKRIQHPFCVALKSSFQDENFLFYVFYFAAGGMLFYHLRQEGKFSETRARFYLGEIVLALDYLHGFSIVFRDLKPENCMLSEQGHVILTDFGSAKTLGHRERASTLAGTPHYMAPEVLRGEPYNYSADWWSSGVLLYEMLTGKTPFYSPERADLYKLVLRCDFKVPNYVSPRARSLLYKLISRDPEFRLGCGGSNHSQAVIEIKEHAFFSAAPMDPDEEIQYVTEEAERERHRQALERSRRSNNQRHHGNASLVGAASSVIRNISRSTSRKVSGSFSYQGSPCEWTWEDLESRNVTPPFKPQLRGPTDLRNFDPIITCVPATLDNLVSATEQHAHIDGFDYVATDEQSSMESGDSGGGESNRVNGTFGGWGQDTPEGGRVGAGHGIPTKTDSLEKNSSSVIEDT